MKRLRKSQQLVTNQFHNKKLLFEFIEGITSNTHSIESRADIIIATVDRLMNVSGYSSLPEYLSFIAGDKAALSQFVAETTIHTTSWFREIQHFKFLKENALAHIALISQNAICKRTYRVASFGCSSGEEVYSIGLVLEQLRLLSPKFDYEVVGFDIDRKALDNAKRAVYQVASLAKIPSDYSSLIWEGTGPTDGVFTVDKAIRDRSHFKQVNITTIDTALTAHNYDMVFLRNTLIYFSKDNIHKIFKGLLPLLKDDGHLVVGHCETILVPEDRKLKSASTSIFIKPKVLCETKHIKKILVIEDSETIQHILTNLLEKAGFLVDRVGSKKELEIYLKEHGPPDLISLDLHMQDFDGEHWLQSIKQSPSSPPVIVVSSLFAKDTTPVINMLSSGVEDYIEKSMLFSDPKAVVSRFLALTENYLAEPENIPRSRLADVDISPNIILIGASTGGINTIKEILTGLPKSLPPIVFVQHISSHYSVELGNHLRTVTGLNLGNTESKTALQHGHLYIATGDYHVTVIYEKNTLYVVPRKYPERQFRPSVDVLFSSLGDNFAKQCVSILLTGMGKDGVIGMKKLHNSGALTIAQDKRSSVVYGMPGEAIKQGVVDYVATPTQIREFLHRTALNQ